MRLQSSDTFIGQDDGKRDDDEEEVFLKGNGEWSGDTEHLLIIEVPVF